MLESKAAVHDALDCLGPSLLRAVRLLPRIGAVVDEFTQPTEAEGSAALTEAFAEAALQREGSVRVLEHGISRFGMRSRGKARDMAVLRAQAGA